MYPFGSLPENLVAFCRSLRHQHGFRIGPGELRDAARALGVVDLSDERDVRNALRPILCGTCGEAAIFDEAFTGFFLSGPGLIQDGVPIGRRDIRSDADGRDVDVDGMRRSDPSAASDDRGTVTAQGPIAALDTTPGNDEESTAVARSSYSPLEAAGAGAPEVTAVGRAWQDAAREFVRRLRLGLSRRWRPATRGRRFDLRRTLRASLQTGGEALVPHWLRQPRLTPRVVLLVDGSRSMAAYAETTLQLAVAMASVTRRVEVFTFSTRLERVTTDVRRAAAGEPRRLQRLTHAWGGGTSIGACLEEFLHRFGERFVGRDTVVIVASDGLDVGEPERLRGAMRELYRRSAGVVWLNPLLATKGYEPTASGMRAARSFVTTFANVTDAAGLARLSRLVRMRR